MRTSIILVLVLDYSLKIQDFHGLPRMPTVPRRHCKFTKTSDGLSRALVSLMWDQLRINFLEQRRYPIGLLFFTRFSLLTLLK